MSSVIKVPAPTYQALTRFKGSGETYGQAIDRLLAMVPQIRRLAELSRFSTQVLDMKSELAVLMDMERRGRDSRSSIGAAGQKEA